MSLASTIGSWQDLTTRLDITRTPERWACRPGLSELTTTEQLAGWTRRGRPALADRVLGELVWLANPDGGDDADAALVLLHLLWPGASKIAQRIQHLCPDATGLVLGELALRIRQFPLTRRHRAYAANLLMDTSVAVWRELEPYRTDREHDPELLVDPVLDRGVLADNADDGEGVRRTLVDLFSWARRTGAVRGEDLEVMVEVEYAREFTKQAQQAVATQRNCTVRTIQRHERRAREALRAAATVYLAA